MKNGERMTVTKTEGKNPQVSERKALGKSSKVKKNINGVGEK